MWDKEDCVRCASLQILIGNVIFLFIYYFVTFFSMESAVRTTIECIDTPFFFFPPWISFVSKCLLEISLSRMFTLGVASGCLRHFGNRMYLFREEGFFPFKLLLSVMPSLVCAAGETCYAHLCASFFSVVLRVIRGRHMGKGSLGERKVMFCIQETTQSPSGCLSCVCTARSSPDTIHRAFCKCLYWMHF